ncbi:unnamed protein product [Malus baccata var. baccata]
MSDPAPSADPPPPPPPTAPEPSDPPPPPTAPEPSDPPPPPIVQPPDTPSAPPPPTAPEPSDQPPPPTAPEPSDPPPPPTAPEPSDPPPPPIAPPPPSPPPPPWTDPPSPLPSPIAPPPPSTTPPRASSASPPPTSSGSTPSTPSKSPPPPPKSSSSSSPPSSGLESGVIIGIAIGAVVILVVLSLCCIFWTKKKKRRRRDEEYYMPPPPPPPGPKVDPYVGRPHEWQQNTPPPGNHAVKMMPKPSPPPPVASRPPHSPQYKPNPVATPPPFTSSSGGSGSNYSGGDPPSPPPPRGYSLGFSKSTFTYEELALATEGFADSNLLGQGGFGYVHKGVLRNGKEVAIKQLKAGSVQGEREFQAEVEIISHVHHRHLVSLVGYCMTGSERLLVYEFVPNNTMEFHLHGKGRPTMDWSTRLKIALGSAKGLAYLHEDCHPKIIHRDIKAANILLDFKFEAKVADFGLAKLLSDLNTHVSTRVMGTFGYLAPEYASSGKLTDKSDVFSFGVMLLELITGRRPVNASHMQDSLVDWARPVLTRALEEQNFDVLVDPKLQNSYDPNEMAHMVACAAACIRHSARCRPRMSQVVRALEGDVSLSDLNNGIQPGQSNVYRSSGSSD